MIQPPYTTGTATVSAGSAIVEGQTTAWALGLVSGGLFTRQGLAVPILSVESDTSLTLAYPWPGAAGTGAYAIDLGRADAASAIVANRRLADVLDGIRGPLIEFRESPDGLWLQYRNASSDDLWQNLILIADLPPGPQGTKGDTGDLTKAQADVLYEAIRTLVTQAAARAGVETIVRGWNAVRVREAAIAADPEVLLASYTAAQLSGLSQIVYDLPDDFAGARIVCEGLSTASDNGINLRCGPAGGALAAGASDYITTYANFLGTGAFTPNGATVASNSAGGWLLTSGTANHLEFEVSIAPLWTMKGRMDGYTGVANGDGIGLRWGRRAVGGTFRRLGLVVSAPLAATGSVKFYGVR